MHKRPFAHGSSGSPSIFSSLPSLTYMSTPQESWQPGAEYV